MKTLIKFPITEFFIPDIAYGNPKQTLNFVEILKTSMFSVDSNFRNKHFHIYVFVITFIGTKRNNKILERKIFWMTD